MDIQFRGVLSFQSHINFLIKAGLPHVTTDLCCQLIIFTGSAHFCAIIFRELSLTGVEFSAVSQKTSSSTSLPSHSRCITERAKLIRFFASSLIKL